MKPKNLLSNLMILAAAAGWGVIGVFSRPLAALGLSPIQITFTRSLITALLMGLFLALKDPSLFKVRLRDFWLFLGSGLLSIVFFNVCYFMTIEKTTLATASVLLYTAPCFVMLMSALFFGEKITFRKIAALVFAFGGCVLAGGFAGGHISLGALMTGIGSGLGYALYSIFGKAALKKYSQFTIIFYTFAVASLGLLPFSGVGHIVSVLSNDGLFTALGLGVFSTFLPFVLYTQGLTKVDAGKASVLAFAEPMVATVAGIVLFHETLTLRSAAGIILIFTAIILLSSPKGQNSS